MKEPADQYLWQCKTRPRQLLWIQRALKSGMVLTDSDLWLGGVDRPAEAMQELRKMGLHVEATRKQITDAAGQKHNDLAWKLAS
jgi:hypothetical protein